MSVVIETTLGDITVDLLVTERTNVCRNFLKLCKMKYYNYNLFHTVNRGFIAQTGDPTGNRSGGESIFSAIGEKDKRYFKPEQIPRIKHSRMGLISFVGDSEGMVGSQFFITLGSELYYLDESHCVFGEVVEGQDVLDIFNSDVICDSDHRPYKDVRITHTVVLDDPFPDPEGFPREEVRSPLPSAERLQGGRIAADEDVDETQGKTIRELQEMVQEREAKARATILEMVGDIPDAEMAPPENVLFVCKLNPVTTDDDLEIIFSRFGKIKGCEVIRDRRSGDSLQYAFVEFEEEKACEEAYFKMDNVLIDDRRVHVDFSQSVAKVRWMGKGKGLRGGDKALGQGKYDRIDKNRKKVRDGDEERDCDKSRGREGKSDDNQHRKRDEKHDRKDKDRHGRSDERDKEGSKRDAKYDKYDERHKSKSEKDDRYDRRRKDERSEDKYNKGSKYEDNAKGKSQIDGRKNRSRSREDRSYRKDNHNRSKDSRRSKSRSRDRSKERKSSKSSKRDSKSDKRKYRHDSSSSNEEARHKHSSNKYKHR